MFILRCDQNRNLEFIKKERIIQGEHCFDSIKVELPENIGEYPISDLSIKMKFVSGSGYIDRQVIMEDGAIYTDIDYTLTETAKRWLFYLTFYYNNDENIEIGKTNSIAIQINKIPYSEKLEVKYKEPEIIMFKGDKGDKGDPGADGKDGEPGVTSYVDLTDKPSVNGTTLSGNKTTSELGLQKKLTAGQNITLESDGTISASGGVTSYNDLTDKPIIRSKSGLEYPIGGKIIFPDFYAASFDPINKTITYVLNLSGNDLTNSSLPFSKFTLQLRREVFKDYGEYNNPPADLFTNYSVAPVSNGIWHISVNTLAGLPVPASGRLMNYYCEGERVQIYATDVFDPRDARYQYGGRYFARTEKGGILGTWRELGGGSQIVSGVVNQNGTITFTDSDGNTFTTTGSSVIGADGFSPTATVTQTASGATVSITDKNGTTTANISNGADGQDYVLTAQDKSDIADIVLSELPTTQGVLYGNTSN